MQDYNIYKLSDVIDFNPKDNLSKGSLAKKVSMNKLQPYTKAIQDFEVARYNGGAKFRNGDTIMARITPCLENGKTSFVDFLGENEVAFGSTEFVVMRAKRGITDSQYVYYLAISPEFRKIAIQSMVGSSGRQRVQQGVLNEYEISLPPLEKQKRIAAILSVLDNKIEINRRINENLEKQAKLIYKYMFIDNYSYNWMSGTLSDIANITMGQSPNGSSCNENGIGEVFYQGRAEFGFRYPTKRLYTTEPKRIAEKGDILLSVRAPVGDINVAYERCCIGRGLSAIHSKNGSSSFLLYTMFALKPQLDVFNGEGTVFGSINRNSLNGMPILIPTDKTIEEFERIVAPMDAAIRNNYDEICRLQEIRDSLLPKLMSGELDVSDIDI